MKYLVTGGCGFIGSHLAERLVNEGHSVCILDNLSNGRMENISTIQNKIRFKNIDIQDLNDTTFSVNFDGIFHLATHPRSFSFMDPYSDIKTNCIGMIRVIELAQ
ncbi:MAG: GDP-mannose 4,6-dehydratase, partial [Nitrosopumilaceae archaeon]